MPIEIKDLVIYMAGITKYFSCPESIFIFGILGIILLPEIFFFYKRRQKLFNMEEDSEY